MVEGKKRDEVHIKAFSLLFLSFPRSPSSAGGDRKTRVEEWREQAIMYAIMALWGQFIFHFIIKNGHVIDEVALSGLMKTKFEFRIAANAKNTTADTPWQNYKFKTSTETYFEL